MTSHDDIMIDITPQVLLKAYSCGIFPMAESADDTALYWIEPQHRGVIPLDRFRIPRRLARTIRQAPFDIRINTDFEQTVTGCASTRLGRHSTWINSRIRTLYREMFELGHCHTVEAWQGDTMVGGLYGVALGGAFFGESMFSTARDASKIALVHLAARLVHGGFTLLDTQFQTPHLKQFGTLEVTREDFHQRLEAALSREGNFGSLPIDCSPEMVLSILKEHAEKKGGPLKD
jgi:leucyl/phenylalanyl-tRNA---protein transferase